MEVERSTDKLMPIVLWNTPNSLIHDCKVYLFVLHCIKPLINHYTNGCSFRMRRRGQYRRNKSKIRRRETRHSGKASGGVQNLLIRPTDLTRTRLFPKNAHASECVWEKYITRRHKQRPNDAHPYVQFLQASKHTLHTHTLACQQCNNKI